MLSGASFDALALPEAEGCSPFHRCAAFRQLCWHLLQIFDTPIKMMDFPALAGRSMALAIDLRADNVSAFEIERLWDQVAAFEDKPSMRTLAYRPHLTFAIYDRNRREDGVECDAVRERRRSAIAYRIQTN
ncbi:hypothetical protein [Bradyrhizobium sp. DASA03007]|uniref:hypothetical protein n=1 Tax=unclassified Bradyrhizobium TaxID=2631580 RepID=UPI003F71D53A